MIRISALKPAAIAALSHLRSRHNNHFTFPSATIGSDPDRLVAAGRKKPSDPDEIATAIEQFQSPALIVGNFESVRYVSYVSTRASRKFAIHQLRLEDSLTFAFLLALGNTVLVYMLNPAADEAGDLLQIAGKHGLSFVVAKPRGTADRITVRLTAEEAIQGMEFIDEARARRDLNGNFDADATDYMEVLRLTEAMSFGQPWVVQFCTVETKATKPLQKLSAASGTVWSCSGKVRARAAFENRANG